MTAHSCRGAAASSGDVAAEPVHGDGWEDRQASGEVLASGAGWLAFLRGLAARGLSGVQLVISDCHHGLPDAIAAVLPGASWQRYRRATPATWPRRCPSRPSPAYRRWSGPLRAARRCLRRARSMPRS